LKIYFENGPEPKSRRLTTPGFLFALNIVVCVDMPLFVPKGHLIWIPIQSCAVFLVKSTGVFYSPTGL
jgi:hypothetical protein